MPDASDIAWTLSHGGRKGRDRKEVWLLSSGTSGDREAVPLVFVWRWDSKRCSIVAPSDPQQGCPLKPSGDSGDSDYYTKLLSYQVPHPVVVLHTARGHALQWQHHSTVPHHTPPQ